MEQPARAVDLARRDKPELRGAGGIERRRVGRADQPARPVPGNRMVLALHQSGTAVFPRALGACAMKSRLIAHLCVSLFAANPILFCLALAQGPGLDSTSALTAPQTSLSVYDPDRILIQPRPGISLAALADFHAAQKIEVLQTFEGIGRLQVLRVPRSETVPGLIAK